jgi:hypothetical protein
MRYTSSRSLFGLPLYDVVVPGPVPEDPAPGRSVARGWLAIGPVAIGLVAFGGLSVGGLAAGGLALGFFPVGGLAAGAIAFGGAAIGYWALGGVAIAFDAALGGVAAAPAYALGGVAFAEHANDPAAREFFSSGYVWPALRQAARHSGWSLAILVCLLLVPILARKKSHGRS